MENEHEQLSTLIHQSDKIAILSGAGVSTGSGVRDFRGDNGLYQEKMYGLSPERILSKAFFDTYRELFYRYYLEHMAIPADAQPNIIHHRTKQLADEGKLVGVVTQNVDGLYQKAGLPSDKLVEIHGNGTRWVCIKCRQEVTVTDARYNEKSGNYLSACHDFLIRPAIVLYDESFQADTIRRMDAIYAEADTLLVMGTSLDVLPHREAVNRFKGRIVLLNDPFIPLGARDWDAVFVGDMARIFRW